MKNILLIFLVLIFLTVYGQKTTQRIIGGSTTTTIKYPYQVALVTDNGNSVSLFCGGSILSKNYILTAGHCFRDVTGASNVDKSLSKLKAVSTTLLSSISANKKYTILQTNIHPSYSTSVAVGDRVDLCIIRVSDISFDSNTLPIVLARAQDQVLFPIGTTSFITGFGLTSGNTQDPNRGPSDQMLEVQLPTLTVDTCATSIANNGLFALSYPIVCAGSDGKDSCSGDSGGPMSVVLNQNTYVLIGVTSASTVATTAQIQCGGSGTYGVYVDVSAYRSTFIEPITGSLPVLGDSGVATNNGTGSSTTTTTSSASSFSFSALFFCVSTLLFCLFSLN